MNILAVDTALGACSAAILADGRVLAQRAVPMLRGHAEALAPMVEAVMREAGLGFADIDRLGVTTGPGTFTGQRVGLAFMRGLRLALKIPLVGVTTLEAMAAAAAAETGVGDVAVLHEARRGEVYAALFDAHQTILPVQVAEFATMMMQIDSRAAAARPLVLAGTGAEAAAAYFAQRGRTVLVSTIRQPDARFVAELAARSPAPADTHARPLYLRAPDARLAPGAIRVRPAGPADAALLAGLHGASFDEAWDAESFAGMLSAPGGLGFVAEANAVALGFAVARVAADEAEILSVGVLPAYRRSGVGRLLLARAAAAAHEAGAAAMFLEVAARNLAAQKLYEGLGFAGAGRRKAYYPDGDDALLLKAALPLAKHGLGKDPKRA